jgi:hypothetical protein
LSLGCVVVPSASGGVEGFPLDDGIMLTRVGHASMSDLTDIDRVGEQPIEMPASKRLAACRFP